MTGGFYSFFKSSIWKAFQKDKTAITKIVANARTAANGSRAWPRDKRLDKTIGCRWDYGEIIERDNKLYRNLVLQPNKDAENEGLRKLAAKNSDAKLAVLLLPLDLPESDIEAALLEAWAKAARG